MTTVEALKELFLALGGDADDVETITTNPEMVHAIAEVAGGAIELPKVTSEDAGDILAVDESGKWAKTEPESGLPEVTSEDNGDVLAVVDGAWAKKTPEGGVVIIDGTCSNFQKNSVNTITFSKQAAEIYNGLSLDNFQSSVVRVKDGNNYYYFIPKFYSTVSGSGVAAYSMVIPNNSGTAPFYIHELSFSWSSGLTQVRTAVTASATT